MIRTLLDVVRAQPLIDRVALLDLVVMIATVAWLVVAILGSAIRALSSRVE
jgi:hypothetical protein